MPNYQDFQTDLLNLGSQPDTGDSLTMVKQAINRSYRKAQRVGDNLNSGREFSITTVKKLTPDAVSFSGSGLDDGTSGGTYSGTNRAVFDVEVDAATTTDTFKWRVDGGDYTAGVAMTGSAQTLSLGVTITFAATTGHTLGDTWTIVCSMYSQYGMPLYVARIQAIIDQTNDKVINPIARSSYDEAYPDTTSAGTPRSYYIFGNRGVQVQPTSASTVVLVSDNSSDDATVRITGFNASDVLISETMTLNGTTNVTSTNTYASIERITKGKTSAQTLNGNLTLTDGTTTLGILPYWINSPDYTWVEFHPIPDKAITYTVRSDMYKPPLVHDEDWPDIVEDYHDFILYDAAAEVLGPFGKPELALVYAGKARDTLRQFKSHNNDRPDQIRTFGDVQMGSSSFPRRPLIKNIDYI